MDIASRNASLISRAGNLELHITDPQLRDELGLPLVIPVMREGNLLSPVAALPSLQIIEEDHRHVIVGPLHAAVA